MATSRSPIFRQRHRATTMIGNLRHLTHIFVYVVGTVAFAAPQFEDLENLRHLVEAGNQAIRSRSSDKFDLQSSSSELRSAIVTRRTAMERIIRTNPKLAASLLLNPAEQILHTNSDIERPEYYRGRVEVVIEDLLENPDGLHSLTHYRYRDDTGDWREAILLPEAEVQHDGNHGCGSEVELVGFRIGETVLATGVRQIAASLLHCKSSGTRKLAVIVMQNPGTPPLNALAAQSAEAFFGTGPTTLASYVATVSRGQSSVPGSRADVFGPFDFDRQYSCSDIYDMRLAAIRIAGQSNDLSQYDGFYILFAASPDCRFGAIATVGCVDLELPNGLPKRATFAWQPEGNGPANPIREFIVHEVGHNLGLYHSPGLMVDATELGSNPLTNRVEEYGDPYSVMGESTFLGSFTAPQMRDIGWLTESEQQQVQSDGEFEVLPLTTSPHQPGIRALRILRPVPGRPQWLWLEYRPDASLVGGPVPFQPRAGSGVFARLDWGSNTFPLLTFSRLLNHYDASMPLDRPWRDLHSSLTITIVEASADRVRLRISYENPCARLSVSLPSGSLDSRATVVEGNVQADPSCAWASRSESAWIDVNPLFGKGDGKATLKFLENESAFTRTGSVTIGRNPLTVTQRPVDLPPSILAISPSEGTYPASFSVNMVVRDPNGTADMHTVDLNLNPQNVTAGGCFIRFDLRGAKVTLMNDNGTAFMPSDLTIGAIAPTATLRNSSCTVSSPVSFPFTFADAATHPEALFRNDLNLRIRVETRMPSLRIFATVTDGAGLIGRLQSPSPMLIGSNCWIRPAVARMAVSSGAVNAQVTLSGDSGTCAWNATTQAPWIELLTPSGRGMVSPLQFRATANTAQGPRETLIRIGDGAITVVQLGTQPAPAAPARLTPPDQRMPIEGGTFDVVASGVGFFVSGQPVVDSLPEWVTANYLGRSTFRLFVSDNRLGAPRSGWVRISGGGLFISQQGLPDDVPIITAGGISNSHRVERPKLLGFDSFADIRGHRLSTVTYERPEDSFVEGRMPEELAGVRVLMNGVPVYPVFVSPDLVRVLIPASVLPSDIESASSAFEFKVLRDGIESAPEALLHGPSSGFRSTVPSFFEDVLPDQSRLVRARLTDGTRIAPHGALGSEIVTRPARSGEIVILDVAGLGPTSPPWQAGEEIAQPLPVVANGLFLQVGSSDVAPQSALMVAPGRFEVRVPVPLGITAPMTLPLRVVNNFRSSLFFSLAVE
jgi:uncharacterized protein (TIGR03437 family)